jgi:hypothetical protein
VVPSAKTDGPPDVVNTYISTGSTGSIAMNLASFLGGSSNFYSYADGGFGYSGGGYSGGSSSYGQTVGSTNNNTEVIEDYPIAIDFEPVEDEPAIEIEKYLTCFSNVPDEGATCSIDILTDIPIDENPDKLLNWQTRSPGHTFVQIRKSNGISSVMQNIGFYPVSGWKTMLTTAPIKGKFVDNSGHEFNAGPKRELTPEKLSRTLMHIRRLARYIKYDIDDYNCTDFALEVFNYTRPADPIEIPRYDLPGGTAPNGSTLLKGSIIE